MSGLKSSDYSVTFKNNKKVGTATIVIKAKGSKYKGRIKKVGSKKYYGKWSKVKTTKKIK